MFDEPTHIAGGYSYWTTGEFRLHTENGSLAQRLAAWPLGVGGIEMDVRQSPGWQDSNVYVVSRHLLYASGNDPTHIIRLSRASMTTVATLLGLCVYVIAFRRYGPGGGLLSLAAFALSPTFLAYGGLAVSDLTASLMFLLASVLVWRSLRRATWTSVLAGGLACGGLLLSKSSGPLIVGVIGVMLVVRLLSREGLTVARGAGVPPAQTSADGHDVPYGQPHAGARARETRGQDARATVRALPSRPARLAGMLGVLVAQAVLAAVVVWVAYGFRYEASPGGEFIESWQSVSDGAGGPGRALQLAATHRLLPEAYLHGVAYTLAHAGSRMSFLAGDYSGTGWWYYFPFCFAVKNPLSWLALLIVAAGASVLAWCCAGRSDKRQVTSDKSGTVLSSQTIVSRENDEENQTSPSLVTSRWSLVASSVYETTPLWALVVVYGLAACVSNINIGHRHILPVYGPLAILIGAAATLPSRRWRVLPIALVALLAAETLFYFPHYVPYMNQLVGGPDNGWRVLGDSSQEWGGELPALKRWVDSRRARQDQRGNDHADKHIYFSYFGSALPAYYDIEATQLSSFYDLRDQHDWVHLRPGVYCISASQLMLCRPWPMGPWNAEYEETYQTLRAQAREYEQADDQAGRTALLRRRPALMTTVLPRYDRYRFARLCAYLRTHREPTEKIRYSFLVFEVTQADLDVALTGPPPELRDRVEAGE